MSQQPFKWLVDWVSLVERKITLHYHSIPLEYICHLFEKTRKKAKEKSDYFWYDSAMRFNSVSCCSSNSISLSIDFNVALLDIQVWTRSATDMITEMPRIFPLMVPIVFAPVAKAPANDGNCATNSAHVPNVDAAWIAWDSCKKFTPALDTE